MALQPYYIALSVAHAIDYIRAQQNLPRYLGYIEVLTLIDVPPPPRIKRGAASHKNMKRPDHMQ